MRSCLPVRLKAQRRVAQAMHRVPVRALLAAQAGKEGVEDLAHVRHVERERLLRRVFAEHVLEHLAQVVDNVEQVAEGRRGTSQLRVHRGEELNRFTERK